MHKKDYDTCHLYLHCVTPENRVRDKMKKKMQSLYIVLKSKENLQIHTHSRIHFD